MVDNPYKTRIRPEQRTYRIQDNIPFHITKFELLNTILSFRSTKASNVAYMDLDTSFSTIIVTTTTSVRDRSTEIVFNISTGKISYEKRSDLTGSNGVYLGKFIPPWYVQLK
jgi:hypothetical protein